MNDKTTQSDDQTYEDLPDEQLAEEITRVSPEGEPAHPEVSPRRIGLFYVTLIFIGIIVGAVVGAIFGPRVGVGFALVILILLLINPETWAALHRARERKKAEQRLRGGSDQRT